jgi:2-keto-4-pentenoate hydratase/2-oxohepta-3-ene-1,7-dioic acid hydratase in catechol pathway
MKLVTYTDARGFNGVGGWLADGAVLDLEAAAQAEGRDVGPFMSMQRLIEAGAPAWDAARALIAHAPRAAVVPQGKYTLQAPLPVPAQMRDFMCFEKHVRQSMAATAKLRALQAQTEAERAALMAQAENPHVAPVWYERPIYYKANRFAVSGPDAVVTWPRYSVLMDYECELACIIGKPGTNIPKERAREHMFGFTIFNDLSARDAQGAEMAGMLGPAKGKDFDGANVLGPCIVTLDEIGDPYTLDMIVRVNGEERSRGASADMRWRFEDLIAFVSQDETLHAGEVFGSGTVGDGCGLEHLRFLQSGDVVELEIPPIGVLRVTVKKGEAA